MSDLQPIIRLPDEGDTLNGMGITITHKARSAETGGSWALVQYSAPSGFNVGPPHYHEYLTEAFYVLEGELTAQVGEERLTAPAGSFVNIPPGVLHTFANKAPEPVTFLLFLSPGGFENYFDDVAQLLAEEGTWPPADMRKVHAIQAKYDMRFPEQVKV
jgi:quercetin dioxygenase-like cupin family protein